MDLRPEDSRERAPNAFFVKGLGGGGGLGFGVSGLGFRV